MFSIPRKAYSPWKNKEIKRISSWFCAKFPQRSSNNFLNTGWAFGFISCLYYSYYFESLDGNARAASLATWRQVAAPLIHGRTHRPLHRRDGTEEAARRGETDRRLPKLLRKFHAAQASLTETTFTTEAQISPEFCFRFSVAAERKCHNLNVKRGCRCIFDTWGEAPHLHLARQVSEEHCRPFILLPILLKKKKKEKRSRRRRKINAPSTGSDASVAYALLDPG